jgi:serine/threonine protein phosphatase 1
MAITYVIPDIHGRVDLLRDGLAGIAAHARDGIGTIVALGDYVDKGPDSKAVIDLLRGDPMPGWPFVALKGNHDAMMVEALRDASKMAAWLDKGGDTVIASYGGDASLVPREDIDWLDRLPLMHADRHRIYVHAGLDPDVPLDRQTDRTLLWKRYPEGSISGYDGRYVVHGHDSFPDGPKIFEGRVNLDTRAWRTGRLVIALFDDDKAGGPIDFIEVSGPASR